MVCWLAAFDPQATVACMVSSSGSSRPNQLACLLYNIGRTYQRAQVSAVSIPVTSKACNERDRVAVNPLCKWPLRVQTRGASTDAYFPEN